MENSLVGINEILNYHLKTYVDVYDKKLEDLTNRFSGDFLKNKIIITFMVKLKKLISLKNNNVLMIITVKFAFLLLSTNFFFEANLTKVWNAVNNFKDEFEHKMRISELSFLKKLGDYRIINSYFEHYLYEKNFDICFKDRYF